MTLQEILSAPQAGFSGLYTPFPMSGTDMVNGAFQEEAVKDYRQQQADQAQQNLIERARAEAVRQDPTLNYVQRKIAQGLLGAKQAYDVANANGNAAGMEAASKVAQGLRKQASSIGWDSGDYGPDVSLDVAAQNMANNDTKAINNLLYGSMNPNAYYKKTMQDYIDMGANRKTAARLAQEDTEEYHSGRFNDMMDSLYMYGMDDRGAINSNGVRILSMMASEDGTSPSEIASYISKMNASPRDNWNFENSMLMAANAEKNWLNRALKQYELGQMGADAAQRRGREDAQWRANLASEQNRQAIADRYSIGQALGLQGDSLTGFALTGRIPSAGGKGSSGVGASKGQESKRYNYLKDFIERFEKKHEGMTEEVIKDDPDYQKYLQRKAEFDSYSEAPNTNVYDWIANAREKKYDYASIYEGLVGEFAAQGYQDAEERARRYIKEYQEFEAGMGTDKALFAG